MLKDILLLEFNYRGFCPEFKSCGLANTDSFYLATNDYIDSLD